MRYLSTCFLTTSLIFSFVNYGYAGKENDRIESELFEHVKKFFMIHKKEDAEDRDKEKLAHIINPILEKLKCFVLITGTGDDLVILPQSLLSDKNFRLLPSKLLKFLNYL